MFVLLRIFVCFVEGHGDVCLWGRRDGNKSAKMKNCAGSSVCVNFFLTFNWICLVALLLSDTENRYSTYAPDLF